MAPPQSTSNCAGDLVLVSTTNASMPGVATAVLADQLSQIAQNTRRYRSGSLPSTFYAGTGGIPVASATNKSAIDGGWRSTRNMRGTVHRCSVDAAQSLP